jgi:hypothetical protein
MKLLEKKDEIDKKKIIATQLLAWLGFIKSCGDCPNMI